MTAPARKETHQLMMVVHGDFVELLAIAGQLHQVCAEGQIKKAEIREIQRADH